MTHTNMKIEDFDAALERMRVDIMLKNSADKRKRKQEIAAALNRRRVAATNKARRQMELLYPKEYTALFNAAWDLLADDDRYALSEEANLDEPDDDDEDEVA